MAPPRATAWPTGIYQDPDVLTLDAQGQFVLCRVCVEHYALFGGKKPKRIRMNACFRTRAWETHKRRTRAHKPLTPAGTVAVVHPLPVAITESASSSWIPEAASSSDATCGEVGIERRELFLIKSPTSYRHLMPRDDERDGIKRTSASTSSAAAALPCSNRPNARRKPWKKASYEAAPHSISLLLNPLSDSEPRPHRVSGLPRRDADPEALVRSLAMLDGALEHKQEQGSAVVLKARCCEGGSATHNCYWTTMRTLFSSAKYAGAEARRRRTEDSDRASESTDRWHGERRSAQL